MLRSAGSGRTNRRPQASSALALSVAALAVTAASVTPAAAGTAATHRAAQRTASQQVRVMTYNVLEARFDGHMEGGHRVAPWSARKVAAARLIQRAAPDVVAVQEAADWAGRYKGPRQIDTLRDQLGGSYALAHTERAPWQKHYFRTGDYILYRSSEYRAIGAGGHWALGQNRFAAYQVLQNRASNVKFLMVSVHLLVGFGRSYDARRQTETNRLISHARSMARRSGLQIVYAGDYNSHGGSNHAFDGPAIAMKRAGVRDSNRVAASHWNRKYDSSNKYLRRPPASGRSVDHVYVDRGVKVRAWGVVLDLRHGRFVGTMASDHNPVVSYLTVSQSV